MFSSYANIAVGIVMLPILTRAFKPEAFGKFSMFTTFSNMFLLLVLLGFDQGYLRYYYEEKNETNLFSKLLKLCIGIYIFLCLIVVVVGEFIAPILFNDVDFKMSVFLFEESDLILLFMVLIYVLHQLIIRFFQTYLRVKKYNKMFAVMSFINKSFVYVWIFAFLYFDTSEYYSIIYGYVLNSFFILSLYFYLLKKKIFIRKEKSKVLLSNIMKYSFPLVFSSIIFWGLGSLDKVFLRKYHNFNEIGIYSVAFKFAYLLNIFKQIFGLFWAPIVFEKHKNKADIESVSIKAFNLVYSFIFIILLLMIAFKDVLAYIIGSDYAQSLLLIPYLALGTVMHTLSEITVQGINIAKKTKMHLIIGVLSLFVNFWGNYLLVPIYGAFGASISTGLTFIVFFYLRTIISNKYVKINYLQFDFTLSFIIVLTVCTGEIFQNQIYNGTVINSGIVYFVSIFLLIIINYKSLKNIKFFIRKR